MSDDLQDKAYVVVDEFLKKLESAPRGSWFNTLGKGSEYHLAKQIMDSLGLITYRSPGSKTSISDITSTGIQVLKSGGIKAYLNQSSAVATEKENLELQSLRSQTQLLTNQLIDYGSTKAKLDLANKATVVVAIVAVIELVLLIVLKSKN